MSSETLLWDSYQWVFNNKKTILMLKEIHIYPTSFSCYTEAAKLALLSDQIKSKRDKWTDNIFHIYILYTGISILSCSGTHS